MSSAFNSIIASCRLFPYLLLLIFAVSTTGCAARHNIVPSSQQIAFAERIQIPGISDAGKVNEFLYRGGQPKGDGIEQLKKLGIDIVVDLRGELHGLIENEREHVES